MCWIKLELITFESLSNFATKFLFSIFFYKTMVSNTQQNAPISCVNIYLSWENLLLWSYNSTLETHIKVTLIYKRLNLNSFVYTLLNISYNFVLVLILLINNFRSLKKIRQNKNVLRLYLDTLFDYILTRPWLHTQNISPIMLSVG